jgi:hypothetical protein
MRHLAPIQEMTGQRPVTHPSLNSAFHRISLNQDGVLSTAARERNKLGLLDFPLQPMACLPQAVKVFAPHQNPEFPVLCDKIIAIPQD